MPFGVGNYQSFRSPQPRPTTQMRPDNRPGPYGANPAFPSLASGPQRATPPPIQTPTPGQRAPAAPQPQSQPAAPPLQPSPINPQPTATPVAPNVSYDYNADPIVQQIKGFSQSGRENAKSDALAAKNKTVVDFGDPTLATTLGLDPGTVAAAAGNQFGVLPTLKRSYDQGAHNLDEQLNNGNLFYSGYRTQQQGNLSHDYQGELHGATGQEGDILGQIGQGLRDALLGYDKSDAQALLNNPPAAVAAVDPTVATPDAATAPDPLQEALTTPPDQQPPLDYGDYNIGTLANVPPADIASLMFPDMSQQPAADPYAAAPIDYTLASQLFPDTPPPATPTQQQLDPLGYALSFQNPKKLLNLAV